MAKKTFIPKLPRDISTAKILLKLFIISVSVLIGSFLDIQAAMCWKWFCCFGRQVNMCLVCFWPTSQWPSLSTNSELKECDVLLKPKFEGCQDKKKKSKSVFWHDVIYFESFDGFLTLSVHLNKSQRYDHVWHPCFLLLNSYILHMVRVIIHRCDRLCRPACNTIFILLCVMDYWNIYICS